jgi:hypothetical protein
LALMRGDGRGRAALARIRLTPADLEKPKALRTEVAPLKATA